MAFFKFIFYALLLLLIKVGDAVFAANLNLGNSAILLVSNMKKTLSKLGRGEFIKPQSINKTYLKGKDTIRLNAVRHGSLMGGKLLRIKVIMTTVFRQTLQEIASIFLFLVSLIVFPLRFVFRKLHRSRARRRGRPRLPVKIRTPFLSKVKYTFIGSALALIFIFIPVLFLIFISDLPKLSNLSINYIPKTTKILDRNGVLLFELYASQNRTIVSLNEIPQTLKNATVAIEDKDFYKHEGFDLRGIARALYVDVTRNDLQGGSTITQQLIKSALLTPEPTISRKVREIALAFWAERQYSKNQILELYFNYVPYGGTAWGVESASKVYFGKNVSQLTLAESSFLAGLPQAPSKYSPFAGDGKSGKRRQKEVLRAMVSEKYITQKEADEAYSEKLVFSSPQVPIQAPHFVMYVKELLVRKYGLFEVERGGLQVKTTLDLNTQRKAEEIVAQDVDRDGYLGVGNGAALVTDPRNGDILAMVGSKDYFDSTNDGNVNITTSLRQPGSTIKLVTYTLALTKGYTEATILDDSPLTISNPGSQSYTPVNYDGRFHGRVPLRIAFANSYNIPAVRVAQKLGVEEIVRFGREMGISSWGSPDNYGVSITLGAAEVSMLELSTAYGVIANQGSRVDLDPILEITDSGGKVIQKKEPNQTQVVDPAVAYIISDILADNRARSLSFGPNSPLIIPDRKVSVKTGTTDNKRDNWTIGFTPEVVVVTWVGNNDNTPLSQALASGITGAAPMWNRIMTTVLQEKEGIQPQVPDNVVSRDCFGYTAYFVAGTEGRGCRFISPLPTFQQQ